MKKFEFTGETKLWFGKTLHRIRALIAIKKWNVKKGDDGGWIEKEENLTHDGDARVSGNARVSGDAHYMTIGPIGSRNGITTFFRDKSGKIMVVCGCFYGDIDAFIEKVKQTHRESKHAKAYLAAAELAKI